MYYMLHDINVSVTGQLYAIAYTRQVILYAVVFIIMLYFNYNNFFVL